jgi:hypothetical protein
MNPMGRGRVQGLNEECEFIDLDKYICHYIDVLKMRPSLDSQCNCPSCRSALLEMRRKRFFRTKKSGF